jgi:hypothetical protein
MLQSVQLGQLDRRRPGIKAKPLIQLVKNQPDDSTGGPLPLLWAWSRPDLKNRLGGQRGYHMDGGDEEEWRQHQGDIHTDSQYQVDAEIKQNTAKENQDFEGYQGGIGQFRIYEPARTMHKIASDDIDTQA